MFLPAQSRAARGFIGWSQSDLAIAASVSLGTVRSFEAGKRAPIANNLAALQRALEAAGVEFIGGDLPGVRLKVSNGTPDGESASNMDTLSPQNLASTQIRAARMLLDWTQEELCRRAGLSEPALVQIERSLSHPKAATLAVLRSALESAGVDFIPENGGGPGVRLRKA